MKSRARAGMVLLEVMLGTAILGFASVGLITLLSQTVTTVRQGRTVERETMSAAETLRRATLRSTTTLDASLGLRRVGAWNVEVQLMSPRLYVIAVRDTLGGARILAAAVYRP